MSMAMMYALKKRAKKMGAPCEEHEAYGCEMCRGGEAMAEGGMVGEEEASGYQPFPDPEEAGEEGIVDRIMKRFSKGGEVANDTPPIVDAEPAEYDDLVLDDGLEMSETGANSGDELGDEQEDEDRRDIVGRVMKSRAKKDKNPRPA